MTISEWLPSCATSIATVVAGLIWGGRIDQRVRSLEEDCRALKALPVSLARVETRLDALVDKFTELNESIRWMRQPADAEAPARRARPRLPQS